MVFDSERQPEDPVRRTGPGNAPNYTGDASVQGGIIYPFP